MNEPLRWHNIRRNEAYALLAAVLVLVTSLVLWQVLQDPPAPVNVSSDGPRPVHLCVNRASEAELMLIRGVGESTAKKIIAERQRNGPFASVENLSSRVGRLNREALASMEPYLDFSVAPPQGSEVAPSP